MKATISSVINGRNPVNSDGFSSEPFHINSCGFRIDNDGTPTYTTLRPLGRLDYQMIYIEQGQATFFFENTPTVLSAGSLVIYQPYQPQHYIFRQGDCCNAYWIHFSGTHIEAALCQLHLEDRPYYAVGSYPELVEAVFQMQREIQLKSPFYDAMLGAKLMELLAEIGRRNAEKISASQLYLQHQICNIIEYMNLHYAEEASVEKYAAQCNISTCHFIRRFRELTGFSPLAYKIKIRMEKAIELMQVTDMRISEIASAVGYSDGMYFSRAFKKYVGVSPSTFLQKERTR